MVFPGNDGDHSGAGRAGVPVPVNEGDEMMFRETDADRDVRDRVMSVTADELRQFIERAESMAAEKAVIAMHEKELFAEAKGRGYDTKAMRKVIALRRRKPDDVAEEQAVLDLYCAALGMK